MKIQIRIVGLIMLFGMTPIASAQDAASGGGTSTTNWFADMFKTDWSKDVAASVGVRLWINEWTTWANNTFLDASGNLQANTTSHTSGNWEVVPIPVASVRWKNLFVSGSYFADTGYNFPTLLDEADREEFDVAMGYYVLPPYLALTAGYKYINQKFGAADFDFDGPTVGFVGAVPMKHGFSLYTNFGFGFLEVDSASFALTDEEVEARLNQESMLPDVEVVSNFSLDDDRESNYWLVEVGVAWTYNVKETAPHLLLDAATMTLGYRHQQVETEGVQAPFNNDDDGIDTTRGVALGVNFTF